MIIEAKQTQENFRRLKLEKELIFHMDGKRISLACPACKEEYTGEKYKYPFQLQEEIKDGKDIFAQCKRCSEERGKPYVFQIIENRRIYRKDISPQKKINAKINYNNNNLIYIINANIENMSKGGIQIQNLSSIHRKIPPLKGKIVDLEFTLDNLDKTNIETQGRVCYVNKGGKNYNLGIAFIDFPYNAEKEYNWFLNPCVGVR